MDSSIVYRTDSPEVVTNGILFNFFANELALEASVETIIFNSFGVQNKFVIDHN